MDQIIIQTHIENKKEHIENLKNTMENNNYFEQNIDFYISNFCTVLKWIYSLEIEDQKFIIDFHNKCIIHIFEIIAQVNQKICESFISIYETCDQSDYNRFSRSKRSVVANHATDDFSIEIMMQIYSEVHTWIVPSHLKQDIDTQYTPFNLFFYGIQSFESLKRSFSKCTFKYAKSLMINKTF